MDQWRWVPTKENPADRATKAMAIDDVWKIGSPFLVNDESTWPQQNIKPTSEEERVTLHAEERKLLDEDDYSDWRKLVRHGVVLKKFVQYVKDRTNFSANIRRSVSASRHSSLEKRKSVDKRSMLNKLVPFLDEKGILRSRSRLENIGAIPPSARNPILLQQKHRVTKLIVRDYHERSLHQADNVVVGNLRQEFWIIIEFAVLNNVKRCCQWCILHACKPIAPQMAPLPDYRAKPYSPTFLHTGVDYFGPFEVAVKRSTEKRWGVIFTCMSTRAVHLELACKLDTDAFLVCLRNFQHRRGKIGYLYSDNGTNFVGAEKQMQNLHRPTAVQVGATPFKALLGQMEKEYIPTLLKRDKWTGKTEPLKEDDIVVITDDNAPPGRWLKGRIVKVNRAPDDQVRSVEISTVNGIVKRPAIKVAPVDIIGKEHLLQTRVPKR
uniref:DUF5641 domain-containing protein n=1 Tax=Anopheles funestus TaxID=62324 RepID=A0A182RLZ3_ANOFN